MKRNICLILLASLFLVAAKSQEYRTIDGSQNNFANSAWGAVGAEMPRIAPADYAFGSSGIPGGINRPHPRVVSNALFSQEDSVFDHKGLSDYVWAFGQFLDHDFSFVLDDISQSMSMQIPVGDPIFDPDSLGLARIPMLRSRVSQGSGTSPQNPRQHANVISSFIDGSAVYGSDQHMATWLRSFEDGKLKVSQGNLLPWNTVDGEFGSPIDPDAPSMGDETGLNEKLFVAGDVRANENIVLASLHTLFVREHNTRCDELKLQYPEYTDEQLYQQARAWVAGVIQSITYNEWLPTLGVELEAYAGYDPFVNPTLFNEFSAAAFRMGHTLLNSEIPRIDANGESIDAEPLLLRDLFFNPRLILESGSLDPLYRGMFLQMQQNMDNKVVDDVRNFLFFEPDPAMGGLDLASINIQRGRERGIADFNTIRYYLGLPPYTDFGQICSDSTVRNTLEELFENVNNIDLWAGLLSEDHLDGSMVGPTLHAILKLQFENLRDGDRFYYENDDVLTDDEKSTISAMTMGDVLSRNTGIVHIPENVFVARDFENGSTPGTPMLEEDLNLLAFPNPSYGDFSLTTYHEISGSGSVTIYDPLGRIVFREERDFEQGTEVIDLQIPSDAKAGLYLLTLRRGEAGSSITLLKN